MCYSERTSENNVHVSHDKTHLYIQSEHKGVNKQNQGWNNWIGFNMKNLSNRYKTQEGVATGTCCTWIIMSFMVFLIIILCNLRLAGSVILRSIDPCGVLTLQSNRCLLLALCSLLDGTFGPWRGKSLATPDPDGRPLNKLFPFQSWVTWSSPELASRPEPSHFVWT